MIGRLAPIFFAGVIALAVIGFLVGVMDGVPQPGGLDETSMVAKFDQKTVDANPKLIPAVSYSEVSGSAMGPTKAWQSTPQSLPSSQYDLYTKIKLSPAEKEASGQLRASRRAFNGAPPIIPHPVENTNDAACYACHGNGGRIDGKKASVMSHPFLGNCVQCHGAMAPAPFQNLDADVDTSFVGLPAPKQGQRAFQGAPPTIPHSRWMRENCSACHGGPNGWKGMESTHPWRTNCTQCHAPSAELDQMPASDWVPMLPPLDVVSK
ncbi:Nitrate reductase cytochrome c-type subunit (NapB) [Rubripirellula lacrimiformis]|uniref:Nitrate reductase cytochrome c-type subunit (NapB) n=1 Tax=Rubripirellula lacrimiformis TaxID=1930273 RepID=A0A517NE43_9BACT|nr:diheme cytochrome c precursor [Rubripirellula lacrimiformis]QDT05403.1 Nitrate reductase cytochrome c-type subunit (NapB) [Rubripirellula lacrimiformis]